MIFAYKLLFSKESVNFEMIGYKKKFKGRTVLKQCNDTSQVQTPRVNLTFEFSG